MRTLLIFLICIILSYQTVAQYTLIPDDQFELYLIALDIDSDGIVNGQVLTSDIENITTLNIFWAPSITDITGIEDFASLELLYLLIVGITEIDLSQNFNLTELRLKDVSLYSLNIDNNVNIQYLHIHVNCSDCTFTSTLSSLNLTYNVALEYFTASGTLVEEFDLSNNINIDLVELGGLSNVYLHYVDLKNGNNINCHWVQITAPNLICVQVDDPEAVIAGEPPYESWNIQSGIITDDCDSIGVNELDLSAVISVFPNPVSDVLYIENQDSNNATKKITIYDLLGKRILNKKTTNNQLDVSHLISGVYLVEITTDKGVLNKKIIKL